METGSPPVKKIFTMVLFALSCGGLLLFLWLSFGGVIPFNPQGYRIFVSFTNAQELANQADVRIAGVNVGKVVAKHIDLEGNGTLATLQIDNKYAPLHQDAKAILRTKTILGETYVQITPGSPKAPPIPDGGMLGRSQSQHAVQLDEIYNAFDGPTRHAFQVWQQQLAAATTNNDVNLSNVIGNLPTFAADATDVLQVLDVEHTAVVNLVRNGGTVFGALGDNQTALRNLITSGEQVFATTAANNTALANTFKVFPTFLTQTRLTMAQLQGFADNTDPLVKGLEPVADNLRPTLRDLKNLSPPLTNLFEKLPPLINASKTGLPAYAQVLRGATPMLAALGNFLEQLNPILGWLALHQQLDSDFITNGAGGIAATTTSLGGAGVDCQGQPCGHYLRQFQPVGPETLAIYPQRNSNDRGNTYPPPLWLADPADFSAGGSFPGSFALPAWDCNNAGGPKPATSTSPACWVAPPQGNLIGQPQKFPHIMAAKYPSR